MEKRNIKSYNKLVRNKVPDLILSNPINYCCITEELEDEDFEKYLKKKLVEEVNEFLSEPSIEELSDITEVIDELAKLINSNFNEVCRIKRLKRNSLGGFEKRILLKHVMELRFKE